MDTDSFFLSFSYLRSLSAEVSASKNIKIHAYLFHSALELAIRKVKKNWRRFNSNGAQELLVYADDVNLLEEHMSQKNKSSIRR
jgi:hypothetical protein